MTELMRMVIYRIIGVFTPKCSSDMVVEYCSELLMFGGLYIQTNIGKELIVKLTNNGSHKYYVCEEVDFALCVDTADASARWPHDVMKEIIEKIERGGVRVTSAYGESIV